MKLAKFDEKRMQNAGNAKEVILATAEMLNSMGY